MTTRRSVSPHYLGPAYSLDSQEQISFGRSEVVALKQYLRKPSGILDCLVRSRARRVKFR